jgi:hypothetical protein
MQNDVQGLGTWRHNYKLEDNIKMDLKAVGSEDVDSIHLVQDTPSGWLVHMQRLYSV